MRNLRSLPPRGWWLAALFACCGLACSGSSDKLNRVEGKVLHKGEALKGALVTFHPKDAKDPKALPATGLTKEDGTFTLTTGQKEGAEAGEYAVTIICTEAPPDAKKSLSTGGAETQDRLRGAYANRASPKIVATVKKGDNKLETWDLK